MTTYRLWPSTNGPALTSYSGGFTGATSFAVSGGGKWLNGYYIWVPTGGDTAPTGGFNCALYCITGSSGPTGVLVPGSTITGYSTTLTANAWNFIPLATPIPLAAGWDQNATANGSAYLACVGWTAAHGFPDTNGYWGSGGAGASGITNGPLIGYSSNSGTANKAPYGLPQGLFSTNANPITTMPVSVSGTDNFWVDVQVSDTAPGGYSGSFCLWPSKFDANPMTTGDAAFNYTVATEISLSQSGTLNSVRYFSPKTATTLATRASVWNVSTGLEVASIASPTWVTVRTGAAFTAGTAPDTGNGTWIKAVFPGGVTLPAGDYRVSVFNSNGTSDANWSPKDATTDYWGQTATSSVGASGLASGGPISAPGWTTAAAGYTYAIGSPGSTPPYSSGAVAHAQPPFGQNPSGTLQFPQLYAPVGTSSNQAQNYWVDLEVTPVNSVTGSGGVTLPGLSESGSGMPGASGSGGVTLPAPRLSGSGTETITGSGGVELPALELSGSGTETITGSGGVELPAPGLSGSGAPVTPVTGSGGVELPALGVQGSGMPTITGSGGVKLPAPGLSGSGGPLAPVTGFGGVELPGLKLAGGHPQTVLCQVIDSGSMAGVQIDPALIDRKRVFNGTPPDWAQCLQVMQDPLNPGQYLLVGWLTFAPRFDPPAAD